MLPVKNSSQYLVVNGSKLLQHVRWTSLFVCRVTVVSRATMSAGRTWWVSWTCSRCWRQRAPTRRRTPTRSGTAWVQHRRTSRHHWLWWTTSPWLSPSLPPHPLQPSSLPLVTNYLWSCCWCQTVCTLFSRLFVLSLTANHLVNDA